MGFPKWPFPLANYSATPQRARNWPAWAMAIKRLSVEGERGVGDTVARVIGPIGGDAWKLWFKTLTGKSCGCERRQADLNAAYPY